MEKNDQMKMKVNLLIAERSIAKGMIVSSAVGAKCLVSDGTLINYAAKFA